MRYRIPCLALALLPAAAGCDRGPGPAERNAAPTAAPVPALAPKGSEASPSGAPRTSPLDDDLQQILGALKLVREEYRAAGKGGPTLDPVEYDETVMFLRRACEKTAALRPQLEPKGAAALKNLEQAYAELDVLVTGKQSLAAVDAVVGRAVPLLEGFLSGRVPPAVAGLVASVAQADAAAQAEIVQDPYRIAVLTREPLTMYLRQPGGALKEQPADPARGLYLGVLVRDRRSKRHLPHAKVRVRFLAGTETKSGAELRELWGDYQQYGANVDLPPDGDYVLEVGVDPPDYDRHADMLMVFDKPLSVRFEATVEKRRLTVRGPTVTPVDPDYAPGDDILQALTEAMATVEAGPYRAGFVAEAPEPVWEWKNGKGDLVEVKKTDTNHIEVPLMDRAQTRMVTGARVTVFLKDRASGAAREYRLYPLLSVFFHYGLTCEVPPGDYDVTARIEPPGFDSLVPGLFEETVEAKFHWDHRK